MTELHKAAFQQSLLHLLSQTQVCCSARAVNSECAMHQNYRYFERKLLDHSNYLEKWKKNLSDTFYFIALKKKKKSINKTTLTQLCPGSSCTAQQHSPLNCRLSGQIRLRATICRRSPARARSTRQCQSYRCPALINHALQLLAWATGDTFLCSTAHCITLLLVPKSWEVLKVQQSFASCLLHSVSPVPDLDKGFNSYIYHLIKWFLQTSQLVNTSTI